MKKPRWLVPLVRRSLEVFPVVVVVGARQTGKTTLVRELLGQQRQFFTLDDLDTLELALTDPAALFGGGAAQDGMQHSAKWVTIDEIQRAPELLLEVKRQVDARRVPGQVLLTGSANLALMSRVSESLAGRAIYLELPPFAPGEWMEEERPLLDLLFEPSFDGSAWPTTPGHWKPWLLKGGMPPALEQPSAESRALWLGSYIQTYLERDLRQLSEVASLPDFQRLMRLAANRMGRLLNQSELARDSGLKQATAHRYLNLLDAGYQLARLPPLRNNPGVEVVKSPKLFFRDAGIASYLAGIHRTGLGSRGDLGFCFEQAVYPILASWCALAPTRRRVASWRDRGQHEVDFVLQQDDELVGLELKTTSRVRPGELTGLQAFAKYVAPTAQKLLHSVVLYTGSLVKPLGKGCMALPVGPLFPATEASEPNHA